MAGSSLVRRFPALAGRLPVAELGRFPTPVEAAPALGDAVGTELWIKREDLSGEAYGGNKVRKLELVLGRALAEGRRPVVTTGAYGSHHVLATCVYAARLGLRATAVLCPQPVTPHVRETLLAAHGTGATLVPAPSAAAAGALLLAESVRRRALLIPPGGSSPLGALAWAGAALELARQVADGSCPPPRRIYAALGSSGTVAGLVLGVRLAGLPVEVVGVRVTPRLAANELTVAALATRASRLLRSLAPEAPLHIVPPTAFRVLHDQYGPGYGHGTEAGRRATELAGRLAGLGLDPTYTAKTMAGLIDDVRRRPPDGPVLFLSSLSSAALAPLLAGAGPDRLPPALRALFSGPV